VRHAIQHVECFHLVLLRLLGSRVDRSTWVVKGDVNLRAWFGSLRYSEDLDIDVVRGSVHSLREKVDRILASPVFREMLGTQGLELSRTSRPKQTETTQRWKVEILASGLEMPLHTRIEFSRRGVRDEFRLEPMRRDVVLPYGLQSPSVNHYSAGSALRQKIEALAARREVQARDVWDLDHLLRTTDASPGPMTSDKRTTLAMALDRAAGLSFDVYKGQVVPYLLPEHQDIYGTPETWERMCELVVERLGEFTA
jgi:hypothetical protein